MFNMLVLVSSDLSVILYKKEHPAPTLLKQIVDRKDQSLIT
jgi:hypothetical protein